MNTVGERILKIKSHYFGDKRGSSKKFADAVGEKSNTISNWFGRKDGIGEAVVDKILTAFPDVDKGWLVGGNGEMIIGSQSDAEVKENSLVLSKGLPYYDVDITLGFDNVVNDQTALPSYYMNVPSFKNCDCAVPCYGRSMVPEINDGAIIAIKEIPKDSVLPGEAYLIITDEYRTVKYIRTVKDNPTKWRLVPENLAEYDEMIIDISKVLRVFIVKGVISNKIL